MEVDCLAHPATPDDENLPPLAGEGWGGGALSRKRERGELRAIFTLRKWRTMFLDRFRTIVKWMIPFMVGLSSERDRLGHPFVDGPGT
jgi:hypothetical protein